MLAGLNIDVVNELTKALKKESGIYRDLLDIAKKKTNIIVEGKVQELETVTRLEQQLVGRTAGIEESREETAGKIAEELGLSSEEITLTMLSEHLEDEQAQELEKQRTQITDILSELKKTNQLNARLIKNSLDYIDFSINLLTDSGAGDDAGSYGSTGEVRRKKSERNFFDAKL
jgi:flagellar biosynthesis/type III secretory pathway chaperone